MNRDCGTFRKRIEDLEGGIPDNKSGEALRAHVASCPSCAAALADRIALDASLAPLVRERRSAAPSEGFAERIVARIQRESVESSRPKVVPFLLRASTRRYAPVAATLAVFLAFGVFASLVAGGMLPALVPATNLTTGAKDSSFAPESMTGNPTAPGYDANGDLTGTAGLAADSRLVLTTLGLLPTTDLKADSGSNASYSKLVASGAFGNPVGFRGYRNADGSLTILLLYPSDGIQDRADAVSDVLAPCASPFRIEIIDGKDIGSTFTALGLADADAFLSGNTGDGYRLLMVDLGR
jgi:hypothetical protein